MKLEINLNDEPAFLNEIKKFIMDNVKGIARNEFEKQIKEIYWEKLKASMPSDSSMTGLIDRLTKETITSEIKQALNGSGYGGIREPMKKLIQEEITKQVKEMFDKKQF